MLRHRAGQQHPHSWRHRQWTLVCRWSCQQYILASSNSLLYALRVLRVHGIPDESLQEVFHATLLAKITYAGPAWHGMCSAGDIAKLESLVKRCRRLGYCGLDEPTLSEMFSDADDHLLNRVVNNPEHVLQRAAVPNWATANLQSPPPPHGSKTLFEKHYHSLIRTSLLGLCTNTAINFHFTTLLLINYAWSYRTLFQLYLTSTHFISISMCICCTLHMSATLLNEYGMVLYFIARAFIHALLSRAYLSSS